jgi:divalent metal cation (Fe/Co/Zn/Cd) transporter
MRPSLQPATGPAIAADAESVRRLALQRRGLALNTLTLGYNVVEAALALAFGATAGSVALIGFGIDSVIEVSASLAARWRLRADVHPARRAHAERLTLRLVGWSFLALAAWVTWESVESLLRREAPAATWYGTLLAAASVLVMPLLARAKRRVAVGLASGALAAEATQTSVCAWLSAIVLLGVGANAWLGWWWADPLAALLMVPIIAYEGVQATRGIVTCADCAGACHAGDARAA